MTTFFLSTLGINLTGPLAPLVLLTALFSPVGDAAMLPTSVAWIFFILVFGEWSG